MAVSGQQIVDYLMQFRGTPYVWGGNSLTDGIDCSGLIQQGMKHFGINIGRTTYDQIGQGKAVSVKDLQVGDTVFFSHGAGGSSPDHVAIYIGGGKMLEAPHTGDVVKVEDMTQGYWMDRFVGARRMDGVVGGGSANNDWPSQTRQEVKLSPQELASQYGWAYGFLNSQPDLKDIFTRAVNENWTNDKFQAELKNTDFWKNNSDTARQALQMKQNDPATWQQTMNANKVKIQEMAAQMGAAVPTGQMDALAEQMQMTGMDDGMLKMTLGNYIDFTKNGTLNGEAGMHEHVMRQYAYDMGVDMSQQSIKNYAVLVTKGLATQEDYQNFIREQASTAYPAFQQQIQAGMTMKNIANPYIQSMAQNLEMNPESISLKDPTIKAALNGVDSNDKPVGMSLVDFQTSLRGDPRWRDTQQAQNQAMAIGRTVLKSMGLVG